MEYETAIVQVKLAKNIYCTDWLGVGQYVYLRMIDGTPSLWVHKYHPKDEHWPWTPTQRDIFRNDWAVQGE